MDANPVVATDPVVLSLEQLGLVEQVRLWSCRAYCQDGRERSALGLYFRDHALFLSRPWLTPVDDALHRIELREAFPLLSALTQAADYHFVGQTAYGEIAPTMLMLAALSGIKSRNTIYRHLNKLQDAGYLYYEPMTCPQSAALIRVYTRNVKTGDAIFDMGPGWRREFVLRVTPQAFQYRVTGADKHFEFTRVCEVQAMSSLLVTVASAPILIPVAPTIDYTAEAQAGVSDGDHQLLKPLAGVAGLDDLFRVGSGLLPDLGTADPIEPDQSQQLVRSFFQDDKQVLVGPETAAPEVGFVPEHQLLASGGNGPLEQREIRVSMLVVGSLIPNGGIIEPGAGAYGDPAPAPAAPPPGPPPAASALFLRPLCQRQLRLGQLTALYQKRGARLMGRERQGLSPRHRRCIEVYERVVGVPFCAGDLPHLNQALSGHPGRFVEKVIKHCAKEPTLNPGYYVVRDGMKTVLKAVKAGWAARKKAKREHAWPV